LFIVFFIKNLTRFKKGLMDTATFFLLAPSILLGLTLHEYAHGWVADRLGDPTARMNGRLTLNPLAHLDFLGTLMLFLVHFGWAKPVPVNPMMLKNPKKDMLLVAVAGPITNFFLAMIFGILLRFMGPPENSLAATLITMLQYGVIINISLMLFNMLPIPPLDGSRVLRAVVPDRYEAQYRVYERFGGLALMGIIILGQVTGISIIGAVLGPTTRFFFILFVEI
jgi:Zn-dependent protease